MANVLLRAGGRALVSAVAVASVLAGASVGTQAADAKKPAAAPPAGSAPAVKAAAAGKPQSAWVKLCEKAPVITKGADGKDVKSEKSLCLTHHERLDGNTGMVLVSAAIRTVEGSPKKSLMIMVPLGMAIPPGIRAAVYSKDQWTAAAKGDKIDEKQLKPIELRYALCHPAGCTAETEATPEILDQMSKGGGIMILAMNAAAQPIGFPVPLDGYNEASAGPPVDNKKYAEARSQLMAQIRQRQQQMAEQWKANEMKNLPPPPTDAPGGPDAPTTTSSTKK
jgi:invasion protein IalB